MSTRAQAKTPAWCAAASVVRAPLSMRHLPSPSLPSPPALALTALATAALATSAVRASAPRALLAQRRVCRICRQQGRPARPLRLRCPRGLRLCHRRRTLPPKPTGALRPPPHRNRIVASQESFYHAIHKRCRALLPMLARAHGPEEQRSLSKLLTLH